MAATYTDLTATEVERIVQGLQKFTLNQVGTPQWLTQHEQLEKLNIQGHKNISDNCEEFVCEAIISYQKVETLIYDLVLIQTWRTKVYPYIQNELIKSNSLAAYFLLYHEATIFNILQLTMGHCNANKEAGDAILDLLRSIHEKFNFLIQWKHPPNIKLSVEILMNQSEEEQFNQSIQEMDFTIAINSLGLLRSITDNVKDLPLCALDFMLVEPDFITTLVHVIESSPWIRRKDSFQRFENGNWVPIDEGDFNVLSKVEAQVWLALMNLALEPECKRKYHYSKRNQEVVLRLKEYVSEETVDQLPTLVDLQRYLEELVMLDPPDFVQKSIGIQPISDIYASITDGINIKDVALKQKQFLLKMNSTQKKEMAERLAQMYDLSGLEELVEDPKCGKCGLEASNRCSLCKTEWYCGRECQVKDWGVHKKICEMIRGVGDLSLLNQ